MKTIEKAKRVELLLNELDVVKFLNEKTKTLPDKGREEWEDLILTEMEKYLK